MRHLASRSRIASAGLVAVVGLAVTVVAFRSGMHGVQVAAKVGGTTISVEHVQAVVAHGAKEAQREGKPFPEKGSRGFRALEQQALDLIVYHEELEQSAAAMGITLTAQQLEGGGRRLGESETGNASPDRDEELFWWETYRGAEFYRRVFRRVTRDIRVTGAEVRADYRAHASLYRLQHRDVAEARASIAANLLETKRNAAMARWVEGMRRHFAGRVEYAAEFRT